MLNPTGMKIRGQDACGDGKYGAPRGSHMHKGVDYECVPGQAIRSPISGMIVREARPYAGEKYSGMLIQGPRIAVKLLYIRFGPSIKPGLIVKKGDVIGLAQDISEKYPGITPHVHLEVESMDVSVLTEEV